VAGSSSVRRALVVDHDPAVRTLIENILKLAGYTVDTASDVEQALTILDPHFYTLLVTDFSMPGLSGRELIRETRLLSTQLPVLVVSSGLDHATQGELRAFGRVECISKPFGLDGIRAALERLTSE
jgi:DNA-binding response OmpR family regulator